MGSVPPGLAEAPLKVRLWAPVYAVAVLAYASWAVIVSLSAAAAAGVVVEAASSSPAVGPVEVVVARVAESEPSVTLTVAEPLL